MRKLLFLSLIIAGCSQARYVAPLKKGQHAMSAGLGGPMINIGAPIPAPMTSVSYGYGATDDITVFSGLHTTSLLFSNLHLDMGANFRVWNPEQKAIPRICLSPVANMVWDMDHGSFKFWPQADAHLYWEYGPKAHQSYLTFSNWFELQGMRSHDQQTLKNWVWNVGVGHFFPLGKGHQLGVEMRLIAPDVETSTMFLDWVSIAGDRGATSIQLTWVKRFGE